MNLEANRKIYSLDEDRIDFYWKDIEKLLETVPGYYDFYTPDWTYMQAKMGHLQIWALGDGRIESIVVTQIQVFPKTKVFTILAAGGVGMLKYFDEAEAIFEWLAADSGCEFIRAVCRPGLARKLRGRGVVEGVLMTRRIKPQRAN